MVKITFEGTVRRNYDETRGQYTSRYMVVTDDGGKYENVLRFKLKPDATPAPEGAKVKVAAYVDGREWTNQKGEIMYFTDFKVDTVEVLSAPTAPAASAAPATAHDWASLLALGAANGEDQAAVTARCNAYKAKVNRRFTPEDYATLGAEIVAAHKPAPAAPQPSFDDDCPF